VPIHAAGTHVKGSDANVIDRVVSSYSFSLTALVRGRQRTHQAPLRHNPTRALLIAMEKTPGANSLPFAEKELEEVKQLCAPLGLIPIKAEQNTREQVLVGLAGCNVFHFAGHGHVELTEPSRSGIRLGDDTLTVGDMLSRNVRQNSPWLSYLSACSTGESSVPATPWVDEGLNLINAFQLTGFRHVIGTLWEISDSQCVEVARVFYKTLLDRLGQDPMATDFAVAVSLHTALRTIRDGATVPEDSGRIGMVKSKKHTNQIASRAINKSWWPYVHFGP
jgi:CHAT domain-containing protein